MDYGVNALRAWGIGGDVKMGDVFDKAFDVVAIPVILANLRIVLPHDVFVVVLVILCVVFSFLLVALTLRKRSNS